MQRYANKFSCHEITENLRICFSAVFYWQSLLHEQGNNCAKAAGFPLS